MAQTPAGAAKAAATIRKKHGSDFYVRIGQLNKGKQKSVPTGFQRMTPEQHKEVSSKGGLNRAASADE